MDDLNNLNDIKIFLNIPNQENGHGFHKLKGVTINEVVERTNLSYVKVSQVLKKLVELKYVEEGLKKGRSQTFYINQSGIEKLKEMKEN